jgi:arsenate reductase
VLRAKEDLAGEIGLRDPAVGDDALLDAMAAHPILIERPIVVSDKGVRLCRPAEAVRELLP